MTKRSLRAAASVSALLWFATGATGQHEHHGTMPHQVATEAKLAVKDDPAAQVLTVRVGPLRLAANTDHMATPQPADSYLTLPFDGWVIAYHPRVVDEAGKFLPNRVLHHVAFWNTGRGDFLCPNKEEHIFGAGGEMNDWPALPGFGYRVTKGDRIRVSTMWHNPTEMSFPKAYLEVQMEYRKAGETVTPLKSVYPTWFDVMKCGNSGYDLKPGKNVTVGEIKLGYTGTLLGVGGHLHDYGEKLVLENATKKEPIAELPSALDQSGHILGMPIVRFVERGGYRLTQGETIRVTAMYKNRTGKPLPQGAMGIVVGYFLPDNDAEMAALQRTATKAAPSAKRAGPGDRPPR